MGFKNEYFSYIHQKALVTPLKCHSCDDFISCFQPISVHCPNTSRCYTVRDLNEGNSLFFEIYSFVVSVITKGCARSCQDLHMSGYCRCETCRHSDYCNSPVDGDGNGVSLERHGPEHTQMRNESRNTNIIKCPSAEASGAKRNTSVIVFFLFSLLVFYI